MMIFCMIYLIYICMMILFIIMSLIWTHNVVLIDLISSLNENMLRDLVFKIKSTCIQCPGIADRKIAKKTVQKEFEYIIQCGDHVTQSAVSELLQSS